MTLENALENLQTTAEKYKDSDLNEAQTDAAFIRPFIASLGYDNNDVFEVVPQYSTAFGDTKKYRVDYAIVLGDLPAILIEVKKQGHPLSDRPDQLAFYVNSTEARFGIYTNGLVYKFFSDLDEEKKMDVRPFMEINLADTDEMSVRALSRFTKDTRGMRQVLAQQYDNPDDDFIQWLGKRVYDGVFTQRVKDHFTPMVRNAFRGFVNERANILLQNAMKNDLDGEDVPQEEIVEESTSGENDKGIETTAEEIEGWMIVKGIVGATLRPSIDPSRVRYKDFKGFFKVLLDGKAKQEICRFFFNTQNKKIRVVDGEGNEATHPIESLDDISRFTDQIRERVQSLLQQSTS